MKTKELFSIALKIIGLIALWKAIGAFSIILGGIVLLLSPINNNINISILVVIIFYFLLNSIIVFIFIFKTDIIIKILKIKDQREIFINIERQVVYHIVIIILGFTILLHGLGNFKEYNLKKEIKTELITN